MADVEMEIDVAPHSGFDDQVDEDLIDYESDTAERSHDQTSWPSHEDDLESMVVDLRPEQSADLEVSLHNDLAQTGTIQNENASTSQNDATQVNLLEDAVASDTSKLVEEQSTLLSHTDEPHHEETDVFELEHQGQHDDIEEAPLVAESNDADDEIDYELGDNPEDDNNTFAEPELAINGVGESNPQDDMLPEAGVDTSTAEQISISLPTSPKATLANVPVEEEQDEITWEQEEGDGSGENEAGHNEGRNASEIIATDEAVHNSSEQRILEAEVNEQHEILEPGDRKYSEDSGLEHHVPATIDGKDGTAVTGSYESDSGPDNTSNSEEVDFPAITVQYRGDEFPCFSLKTSEGFFSDTCILDDSVGSLLAGFRSELVNEIPPEEELVFQIDELGLEFAESNLRDSLSSITLRQIIEIFDLLVKNQDPDNSRTLYTYLFTRPNTSKRFDFLVESAAAGKGLDEIIHLFQSPMPQNTAIIEASNEGLQIDENADSPQSATHDDDHVSGIGQLFQNPSNGADEDEHDNSSVIDQHEEAQITYQNDEVNDVDDGGYADTVDNNGDQNVNDGLGDNVEDAENDDVELMMDEIEHEAVEIPGADVPVESDYPLENEELHSPINVDESNEQFENDLNPLPNQHHDEGVPDAADQAAHEEAPVPFEAPVEDIREVEATNTDAPITVTEDTEVSSDSAYVELNNNVTTEEIINNNDDFVEIDWQDEPVSASGNEMDAPSAISKRTRTDEEPSVGDEKDAKRRRS